MPWIHADDVVGIFVAALADERWEGAVNATRARAGVEPRLLARARAARCTVRRCCRCPGCALRVALRRDGADRHGRRARGAGQAADARLPVPPSRARRGAARGARALTPAPLTRRRARRAPRARPQLRGDAVPRGERAVVGLDDHAAGPRASAGRRRSARCAARRAGRGSSTSRSTSQPTRSASSTSAAPGLRVRISPVWILMPVAPRLDARALEHRAPVRLLLLEPRLQRELAGHRQHEDRVDDPFLADQLGGAVQRVARRRRRRRSARARCGTRAPRSPAGVRGARSCRSATGRAPGGGGRGSSRPSRPPSMAARSCAPRRAARRPSTRRANVPIAAEHGGQRDRRAADADVPRHPVRALRGRGP